MCLYSFAVNLFYSWALKRKIVFYDPLLKGSVKLTESSSDDTTTPTLISLKRNY